MLPVLIVLYSMMKFLQRLLIFSFTLLILFALSIWLLTKYLSPETITTLLSKQITEMTRLDTKINGTISWQLLPRPGLKITKIQVGYHEPLTLSVDNITLHLLLRPLLQGKILFSTLNIDKFIVNVDLNAPYPTVTTSAPSAHKNSPSSLSSHVAINKLSLTRGEIHFKQGQNTTRLSQLQIGAKHFNLKQQPFPLQISGVLSSTLNQRVTFNFKGSLGLSSKTFLSANPFTDLGLEGQLSLQQITLNRFHIDALNATIQTKQNKLILNPINTTLYGGKAVGDVEYQLMSKQITVHQIATHLNTAPFFNDLNMPVFTKGKMDATFNATTSLKPNAWQHALQANGHFIIKDGVIAFIDLNSLLKNNLGQLHQLVDEQPTNPDASLVSSQPTSPIGTTTFETLSIQYHIANDTLYNDTILLQTKSLQLSGNSQIDFNTNDLAGHLSAQVSTRDKTISRIQQLLGGSFPLRLTGQLLRPILLPDRQVLQPILARYLLQKRLQKPVKILEKGLNGIVNTPNALLQVTNE